jgi:adenine modification enzyme
LRKDDNLKGYIEEPSLFGHGFVVGFGDDDFFVKEIDRTIANDVIVKNHYSKKFYSATYIHLGVYINKKLVGILQYGYAMNPASCGSVVEDTEMDEYLELNRMWLDDIAPRNSESKAISCSIKYIKRKYPKIKWIQSFADERCGKFGIVYQAANFKYFGEHDATFWTLDGVIYHNTLMTAHNGKQGRAGDYLQANKHRATSETLRQFRYLYFIDKREEKKVLLKERGFEKWYKQE